MSGSSASKPVSATAGRLKFLHAREVSHWHRPTATYCRIECSGAFIPRWAAVTPMAVMQAVVPLKPVSATAAVCRSECSIEHAFIPQPAGVLQSSVAAMRSGQEEEGEEQEGGGRTGVHSPMQANAAVYRLRPAACGFPGPLQGAWSCRAGSVGLSDSAFVSA